MTEGGRSILTKRTAQQSTVFRSRVSACKSQFLGVFYEGRWEGISMRVIGFRSATVWQKHEKVQNLSV